MSATNTNPQRKEVTPPSTSPQRKQGTTRVTLTETNDADFCTPPANLTPPFQPRMFNGRCKIFLTIGIISLLLSSLPWLGYGRGAFVVPGWDIHLPTLSLTREHMVPFGEVLTAILELPLTLLSIIRPLDYFIYFQGEGVRTARPFTIFLFWHLCGVTFVWLSVRPLVFPAIYGHRENFDLRSN
ncbi:hypothetical protein Pan189_39040 [Stratiformator vulcanicus]|uniref:Uncharacterized protein n=1 Tax=Stratiformator vulcanicus TaxID=2527980 RepID=A0A517R6H4_9PLAN|nr:hypothetical protein Pan189_39040 [Stratiformator vulcanicus]